jgi:catechol 2,3-dioxygenase-like lactoylglutathione lyase family enzyme
MKIKLASVIVRDQAEALQFYTGVLGFVKAQDIPMGGFRWLTVVSPDGPGDVELVLEPNENPAARIYQEALRAQGIPLTAFAVESMQKEFERLTRLGVVFHTPPMRAGSTTIAIFDDTCGNLIQIFEG